MALIKLSKSSINSKEIQSVVKVLRKEFLGMGKEVISFENLLTKYFKRETVCLVNGFSALHIALEACGIGKMMKSGSKFNICCNFSSDISIRCQTNTLTSI